MASAGERALRRAAVLALLAAAVALPARPADFKESFKKGIEAADRNEWSEVERQMRAAIAAHPQEGESVKIYGVRFEPYLPHFYLGLALFQAGNCEGALEQWQESERQSAVQGTARYKTLTQNRNTCRQRIAAKAPAPSPPPRQAPVVSGPDPAQVAREAEARRVREKEEADRQARETREREEAAAQRRKQEQETAEAARAAQAARAAETERIAEAANRERAQREDLTKQVRRAATDAKQILDRAAGSRQTNPALTKLQGTLRESLRKSSSAGDNTPLSDLTKLRDGLSTSSAALEAALLKAEGDSGPPAELRAAARAYFRADYEEVVRTLGQTSFQDRRATVASHLLLAAARYSLFLQGGEKNAGLRDQAAKNARDCRQLDPKVQPDGKLFSPRFTEFFKTAG